MLDELEIKTAVIDRLYLTNALENAVLINEMVIANWSRRTDLTVVNGKLHAFEIKSDLDNLDRLEGQITTYLTRFDKVTVVTTPRFLSVMKEKLPENVELWEISELNSEITIRTIRRGKTKAITNKRMLCEFLHKPELVSFLKQNDIASSTSFSRNYLIGKCEEMASRKLRDFVLFALKNRYKNTFNRFDSNRNGKTKIEDLLSLSKSSLLKKTYVSQRPVFTPSPLHEKYTRTLDISSLRMKYGLEAENIQKTVLLRKPS
ncbi:sce7726 family protein [Methylophilus sp. Leaf408]|uniref:sce7726 family protein n=1 Tax=Methylophilus sp. Leaf408 TaxID=2876561 RepID=UPI001E3DD38E|nr:sce7726 family protein [Methylophilus sp. Leaf408]